MPVYRPKFVNGIFAIKFDFDLIKMLINNKLPRWLFPYIYRPNDKPRNSYCDVIVVEERTYFNNEQLKHLSDSEKLGVAIISNSQWTLNTKHGAFHIEFGSYIVLNTASTSGNSLTVVSHDQFNETFELVDVNDIDICDKCGHLQSDHSITGTCYKQDENGVYTCHCKFRGVLGERS